MKPHAPDQKKPGGLHDSPAVSIRRVSAPRRSLVKSSIKEEQTNGNDELSESPCSMTEGIRDGKDGKRTRNDALMELFMNYSCANTIERLEVILDEVRKEVLAVEKLRIIEFLNENALAKDYVEDKWVSDVCIANHTKFIDKTLMLNEFNMSLPFIDVDCLEMDVENILCIPLRFPSSKMTSYVVQFINRLDVNTESVNPFSEEDLTVAQQVASLITKAIMNIKRRGRMEEQSHQIQVLSEVAKAVCMELDGATLIPNLIKIAASYVNCMKISLYVCDETKKEVFCVYSNRGGAGERIPYGVGIVGTVASTMEPLNIQDLYNEVVMDTAAETKTREKSRSVLAVPVMIDKQQLGVLKLTNKLGKGDPNQTGRRDSADTMHLLTKLGRSMNSVHSVNSTEDTRRASYTTLFATAINPRASAEDGEGSDKIVVTKSGKTQLGREGHSDRTLMSGQPTQKSPYMSMKHTVGHLRPVNTRASYLENKKKMENVAQLRGVPIRPARSSGGSTVNRPNTKNFTGDDELTMLRNEFLPFNKFDMQICDLICSRIAQALRVRMVDFQYNKAISDNSASDVLRLMIYEPDGSQQQYAKTMRGHKASFQAIGKFLKVLKQYRVNNTKEGTDRGACSDKEVIKAATSDEEAGKLVHEMAEDILRVETRPDEELFHRLALLHNRLVPDKINEQFSQWHFDVLDKTPETLNNAVLCAFTRLGLVNKFRIPESTLKTFISEVQKRYLPNPYHNWFHAVSVLQQVYSMLLLTSASQHLHFQDVFALMIAALCHDVGHKGRTNEFESKTFSELAIRYNDTSILEQHHASVTFQLLMNKNTNIMIGVSTPKFKELRKLIISYILNTDMKFHGEILTRVKSLILVGEKSEDGLIIHKENQDEREVFCGFVLHCCDIGAQTFPTEIASKWADRVLQEFQEQANDEIKLNLPLTPFMENLGDEEVQANVQIGFISFVVEPTWQTLTVLLPQCSFTVGNIEKNKEKYERIKEKYATKKEEQQRPTSKTTKTPANDINEGEVEEEKESS